LPPRKRTPRGGYDVEFSDIEFILYFYDEVFGDVDQEEWVARIAPVELYYVNEFGNGTAIFKNLIRAASSTSTKPQISRG
jgi:hypothetical protein